MSPREAAVERYTERERALINEAAHQRESGHPLTARETRRMAILLHRAMLAEVRDPAPIEVQRRYYP